MATEIVKAKVIFLSGSMRLSGSATWMNTLIAQFQNQGIACTHIITGKKTAIQSTAYSCFYTGQPARTITFQLYRLLRLHKWNKTFYDKKEMQYFNRRISSFLTQELTDNILVIKDFTAFLPSFFQTANSKIVAVIHQQFEQFEQRYYYDYLVTVSEKVNQQSIALGFSIDRVIYNPIARDKIMQQAIEYHPTETDYLLFVGSLVKEKGIWELIYAYQQLLQEQRISSPLVLVGDGKECHAIRRYITQHSLEKMVLLKGFLPNPYPYIAHAKLLILPSYSEAMGYVAIEASVLKTAFIVANFAAASEFYREENRFEMGCSEQEFIANLKMKIVESLISPSSTLSSTVLERFDTNHIVRSYLDFLT